MEYTQWNDSFIFTHKKHAYRAVIAFQFSNEWKKMEEKTILQQVSPFLDTDITIDIYSYYCPHKRTCRRKNGNKWIDQVSVSFSLEKCIKCAWNTSSYSNFIFPVNSQRKRDKETEGEGENEPLHSVSLCMK